MSKSASFSTSAMAAASELINQATEATQKWNAEVQSVNKTAEDEIKVILQAKESANQAHQLMISNLNKAHALKLKSYDEKIETVNKVRDTALIGLEAKNAPVQIKDSGLLKAGDAAATKILGSIGAGFGYIKSKLNSK